MLCDVIPYRELPNLPVVHQMVLCLRGDGIGQSLLQDKRWTCINRTTFRKNRLGKNHSSAGAYVAELSGQDAHLVDGVEGYHGHGGHCQTPPHHVCPWRKYVGTVDGGVEGGEAHHHHKLQERIPGHWIGFMLTTTMTFLSIFGLTRRKQGLTNFQHSLQYVPGRWPIISSMSSLNRSTPETVGSIILKLSYKNDTPYSTHLSSSLPGRHLCAKEFTQTDKQVFEEAKCTHAVDSYGKNHSDRGSEGLCEGVMRGKAQRRRRLDLFDLPRSGSAKMG